MLATKKKGYALIYAICAIMIISALMMAILSLSLSNRTTTAYYQKSNKARLLAEEGMETGVKAFKKHISDNFTEYIAAQNSGTGIGFIVNTAQVTQTNSDGSSYSYTFAQPAVHPDNTSGNQVNCIAITATGTFQNITKTITAYIAENDISNIYYDKMFTHPVTQDAKIPPVNANISETMSDHFDNLPDTVTGNPYMVTMKRDYDILTPDQNTLRALTDDMYSHITSGADFKNINVSAQMTKLSSIQNYLDSITSNNADGTQNNYVQDMLKFSTFYKAIFIHVPTNESLQVGVMKDPLINYIIYCDGTINVTSDSNLKLWNCNIYANAITYNGEPTKLYYAENSKDVTKVLEDPDPNTTKLQEDQTKPKNVDVTANFDIKGIGSQSGKDKILKYILANDSTNNNPYSNYVNSLQSGTSPTAIFTATMAGNFSETDRVRADTNFYSYLDGYAYGLKLRYVDIKFN